MDRQFTGTAGLTPGGGRCTVRSRREGVGQVGLHRAIAWPSTDFVVTDLNYRVKTDPPRACTCRAWAGGRPAGSISIPKLRLAVDCLSPAPDH
eukprot:4273105-Alexandrium_andersonii.AAC.1